MTALLHYFTVNNTLYAVKKV